jgi:hypothetical protein
MRRRASGTCEPRYPRASRSSVPSSLGYPRAYQQPATIYQLPATSNQKPNAPPRLWYPRASVPSSLKIIGTLEPRVPSSLPATSTDLPATSNQQPEAKCAAAPLVPSSLGTLEPQDHRYPRASGTLEPTSNQQRSTSNELPATSSHMRGRCREASRSGRACFSLPR